MTGDAPARSLYDQLGGEVGVRALVDVFYDEMDRRPGVKSLRDMHPPDLKESREKLFWFMSGWLGGPPLYMQKKGHPRLRARHMPFAVDELARDHWMLCMRAAIDQVARDVDAELLAKLDAALFQLADHMRNQ